MTEFWEPWFEGKTFSTDWASRAFPTWIAHLSDLRNRPLRILEIGSWEGRSTIFFLKFFPQSVITCIDLFTLGNERAFDSNVAEYGNRVTKIAASSRIALSNLCDLGKKTFDLIYVDGSHDRDDVMIDTLLAWRLLPVGGILIWDDYDIDRWVHELRLPDQWPKPAIDVFRWWHSDEMQTIVIGYQLIVRKTKPHFGQAADRM
jgi:hypothetical protein